MKTTIRLFSILFISILTFASCTKMPMACCEVPATGVVGQSISFSSACSMDAGSYEWNFGDGVTSKDANPMHTYSAKGTYTVKMMAMSKDGEKMDETTKSIIIN